jgi:glutamine cyclotransferase
MSLGEGRDSENAATFSTRFKFPEYHDFGCMKTEALKAARTNTPELAELEQLNGVVYARVYYGSDDPFTLHIRKGSAFSWEELEPAISKILVARHMRLERLERLRNISMENLTNVF